jgi:class 3 adenylate cyclase
VQTCRACGHENPRDHRFCGGCGGRLAHGHAREERKVVTALFVDLVGFTGRAERLDPEDVRALLSPYYARLRAELERYGGTVEKFIGDAVMALFGAPVAHEDDPERAVRAALAVRDAVADLNDADAALGLQVRIGVATGEALVALGARPEQGEGMAAGDVVNTAARLQAAAPVDGILVGAATYRATRHVIEYRDREPVEAKGKSEPVPVWEALGTRGRFGIGVEERLRTPLVGRARETAFLADALQRCRTDGQPQLVTLVGVPGIGKSRLVSELMAIVDADPDLIWWRQGRSLPYGEGLSYWALGEIVKAQAGILESDSVDDAAAKVAAMVGEAIPDAEEAAWVEGHVRPLVGLDIGAGAGGDRRTEAFSAWRQLLESLAEQRPLVLVFDDLHWADDGLLDFIDHLADWASGVPLLVVCTARPELLARRPDWGGGKRNATTTSVGPLSREETAALLAGRLERALLPADVQERLLAAVDGNPLYVEEYVRMLQDLDAATDLPLPETVQGVIAARLDGLPQAEKELLQDASVLGKVFWRSALVALGRPEHELDDALHALERKEFVRRERRSAVAGEQQYSFLHALVRDVAYGQIPRARRVEKHRLAAGWIESLAPDRSEDRAEMLAHHYLEAVSLARAAGLELEPLRGPAVDALLDASERASTLFAWPAARELADAAVELMEPDDPRRAQARLAAVQADFLLGRLDIDVLLQLRADLRAADDLEGLAAVAVLISRYYWLHGDGEQVAREVAEVVELVEALPPSRAKAEALGMAARLATVSGSAAEGLATARRARAATERIDAPDLLANVLNTIGMARVRLGDRGGFDDLRRAIEVAEAARLPEALHTGWNNLANSFWMLGDLDAAHEAHVRCRASNERFGYVGGLRWLLAEEMLEHHLRGSWTESERLAVEVVAAADAGDAMLTYLGPIAEHILVTVRLARGAVGAAVADSARLLAAVRESRDDQQLGPARLSHAQALLAAGRREEADALANELMDDGDLLSVWVHQLPLLLVELDRGADYVAALAGQPETLWTEAGVAAASGRFADAVAVYERIGARAAAAKARVLGGIELDRARDYYRSIGAALADRLAV